MIRVAVKDQVRPDYKAQLTDWMFDHHEHRTKVIISGNNICISCVPCGEVAYVDRLALVSKAA